MTQVIDLCKICNFNKAYAQQKQSYGRKIIVTGPRQLYHMDYATIDQKAENKIKGYLIIVDAWSLFTICVPLHETQLTAREIVKAF